MIHVAFYLFPVVKYKKKLAAFRQCFGPVEEIRRKERLKKKRK
jgi:hypothetical protein